MTQARDAGFRVLLALIVPNDQADTRFRIDNRVLEGGHTITDVDLKRREPRILAHLPDTITLADLTAISVSSTRSQDFTLEGEGSDVQLPSASADGHRPALRGAGGDPHRGRSSNREALSGASGCHALTVFRALTT